MNAAGEGVDTVVRITSAPDSYDGFGTETIEVLGRLGTRGRTYRRVRVAQEHEEWQRARYLSGLYVCLRADEFEQWAEWALI
jgi:hypothetical protein